MPAQSLIRSYCGLFLKLKKDRTENLLKLAREYYPGEPHINLEWLCYKALNRIEHFMSDQLEQGRTHRPSKAQQQRSKRHTKTN